MSDRSRLSPAAGPGGLVARLAAAAAAGVDLIQLREPDLTPRDLIGLVRRVLAAIHGTGTRLLVNDRLDVALAAGAHGVHLKGESLGTVIVRALVPAGFVVGRSAHSADTAEQAAHDGADYVVVGTVFESVSKPGRPPQGLALLAAAAARCHVPVLGIGGITAARAAAVAATGAAGVAAIGLFMGPDGDAAGLETTVAAIRDAFARESEDR